MSKFNITKKISLAPLLGEGHEADYLAFKPLTFKDARKLQELQSTEDFTPQLPPAPAADADAGTKAKYEAAVKKAQAEAAAAENDAALEAVDKAVAFIAAKFVEGKIGGVDVSADDFTNDELSVDVINYAMKELAGAGKPEGFTQG